MAQFISGGEVRGDDSSSVFGRSQASESALIGIMYDLKQTDARQPTSINPGTYYSEVLNPFLTNKWDETILKKYYCVSRPLYTTQIFIPNMNAVEAPKAFAAEKLIQPSRWVIHYKGQVSPPSAGTYRFWGCADDALAVGIDGKSELVYCMGSPVPEVRSDHDGAQAADNHLRPGTWFTVKADEIIDLDIIIGECPGGWFSAFLMIQKQGDTYQSDAAGNPILPIFQVAPYDTPANADVNSQPAFSKVPLIWKCYQ